MVRPEQGHLEKPDPVFYLGEDGELWEQIDEGYEDYTEWARRYWVVLQNFHNPEEVEQWWTDMDGFTALRELTPMEVVAYASK